MNSDVDVVCMEMQLLQAMPAVQGRDEASIYQSAPAGSPRQMVSACTNLQVMASAFQMEHGAADTSSVVCCQGELVTELVSEG